MPSVENDPVLAELGVLLDAAVERGDSITAIAERAGLQRSVVSGIRNGTYRFSLSFDKVRAICDAIGIRIRLVRS